MALRTTSSCSITNFRPFLLPPHHRLQQQHITHKFPVHKKSIHNKERSQGELHNGSICSKFFDGVCSIKWVEFVTKKKFKDFLADTTKKCEKAHLSAKDMKKSSGIAGHYRDSKMCERLNEDCTLSMHQSSHFAISFFTSFHDFSLIQEGRRKSTMQVKGIWLISAEFFIAPSSQNFHMLKFEFFTEILLLFSILAGRFEWSTQLSTVRSFRWTPTSIEGESTATTAKTKCSRRYDKSRRCNRRRSLQRC